MPHVMTPGPCRRRAQSEQGFRGEGHGVRGRAGEEEAAGEAPQAQSQGRLQDALRRTRQVWEYCDLIYSVFESFEVNAAKE